jgi:hypothetical protein
MLNALNETSRLIYVNSLNSTSGRIILYYCDRFRGNAINIVRTRHITVGNR